MLSPSRADPQLRKKILKRVNQRFSVDFEEESSPESKDVEKYIVLLKKLGLPRITPELKRLSYNIN